MNKLEKEIERLAIIYAMESWFSQIGKNYAGCPVRLYKKIEKSDEYQDLDDVLGEHNILCDDKERYQFNEVSIFMEDINQEIRSLKDTLAHLAKFITKEK